MSNDFNMALNEIEKYLSSMWHHVESLRDDFDVDDEKNLTFIQSILTRLTDLLDVVYHERYTLKNRESREEFKSSLNSCDLSIVALVFSHPFSRMNNYHLSKNR